MRTATLIFLFIASACIIGCSGGGLGGNSITEKPVDPSEYKGGGNALSLDAPAPPPAKKSDTSPGSAKPTPPANSGGSALGINDLGPSAQPPARRSPGRKKRMTPVARAISPVPGRILHPTPVALHWGLTTWGHRSIAPIPTLHNSRSKMLLRIRRLHPVVRASRAAKVRDARGLMTAILQEAQEAVSGWT